MPRPAKPDLKDKILSVASEKFFRHGFSRVSIDELVMNVRTSKSAVYKFFPSKEDLLNAVLVSLNQNINLNISLIVNDSSRTFLQKLEAIITFTSGVLQRVSKDFIDDMRINAPGIWQEYLKMRKERLDNLYLKFFKQGVKQGYLRKDIPLNFILLVYTKLTEIVVDPSSLDSFQLSNKNAYNMLSRLFLEGAKPK